MQNIFDITSFGAVGDGKTDCTQAIQQALDKAGEVHGTVLVPPGTYLTGRVHLKKGARMQGEAGWAYRTSGISTLKLKDADAPCLLDITGAVGGVISGLNLEGEGLGENVHGIYLHWDKYNGAGQEDTVCIENCRARNFSGDGIHLARVWAFTVRQCMMLSNQGSGLFLDGWDGWVIDNIMGGNRHYGFLGAPIASSITFTSNRIEWNRFGGVLLTFGDQVNLTGNYFDRNFGPAITFGSKEEQVADDGSCHYAGSKYQGCTVTGNVFYRNGCTDKMQLREQEQAHIYLLHAENITVSGNSFRIGENDGGGGARSPQHSVTVENSDSVVVQNNVMKNGSVEKSFLWDGQGECIFAGNTGVKE